MSNTQYIVFKPNIENGMVTMHSTNFLKKNPSLWMSSLTYKPNKKDSSLPTLSPNSNFKVINQGDRKNFDVFSSFQLNMWRAFSNDNLQQYNQSCKVANWQKNCGQ